MPVLVFQNGSGFDIQWLYEVFGIKTRGYHHDTCILHHSIFPELPKGLAFMASLYADYGGEWKALNRPEKAED